MPGSTIKIPSSGGGEFDCYVARPAAPGPAPAIVFACAILGVDRELCDLADEFAGHGYFAAAPDLFWRSVPGALVRGDKRAAERGSPRDEKIRTGEADMVDTLNYLRTLPGFNGRAIAMGLCYGGPYAIIAPKRLGFEAGVSVHGSRMWDYVRELEGVDRPVCIVWGDKDHQAPAEVLETFRAAAARFKNLDLTVFPGIQHGFMMPSAGEAYDKATREFSIARALALLGTLRGGGETMRKVS